jgi:tetratricopeptide (TPR) repeat protein
MLSLAICLVHLQRPAEAITSLSTVVQELEHRTDQSSVSELASALNARAVAYCFLGKYLDAGSDVNRAIEKLTSFVTGTANENAAAGELAVCLNTRGLVYLNQGNLPEALKTYEDALSVLPPSAPHANKTLLASTIAIIAFNHSTACLLVGDYPTAISDLDLVISIRGDLVRSGLTEISDSLADAYANRGSVYMMMGKSHEAIEDIDRALGILTNLVDHEGRSELTDVLAAISKMRRGIHE